MPAKAARYVAEGWLRLLLVDGDLVRVCRGTAMYSLGHDLSGTWWCDCPARVRCAHLAALQALVQVERGRVAGVHDG